MFRLRTPHLCAALLLLTLGAYLPVWDNGFVDFDDEPYITANAHVNRGLTWSGFAWDWTTYDGVYWQPISWLSLQLDAQLFAVPSATGPPILPPAAFHGENLFWHAAGVLLLFGLFYRLTGARWRSFLVAALFAVHPLHVESVAWASERKDVLSAFFGIVTLWAYVHYLRRPGWRRYLLVAGAFLLSLLSKPMLITLPFVLLLLDYWPLCRLAPTVLGRLILEKVPLLALAAAVALVTMLAQGQSGKEVPFSLLPLSARLANAASAYGWYLAHTFVPVRLAVLYQHPGPNWSVAWVLAGSAALVVVTLTAWRQARQRPWLLVGWLWFVGTLVPVIGLVQVGEQAQADRFTYWPHIGLFVIAAWGLGELVERFRVPAPVAAATGAAALACLVVLTWLQAGYWHDSTTLWERALAVTADNHRAHQQLGQAALALGRPDEAESHFAEAVRIHPELIDAQFALGIARLRQGKLDEAAGPLEEVVRRAPGQLNAWRHLAAIRMRQGKPGAAARCFRKALELDPDSPGDVCGLGEALWLSGERQEAIRTFQGALRVNPADALAWHELGAAHLGLGNLEAAIEEFRRALRLHPELLPTRSSLGLALGRYGQWADAVAEHRLTVRGQEQADQFLEKQGRPPAPGAMAQVVVFRCRLAYALDHAGARAEAAEVYRAALQRDPEWPGKFAAEARALATDPDVNRRDPRLALEMIGQALAAAGDPSPARLDVLAAAQAGLGQYPDAVRTERQALEKAAAAGETALLESLRDHLRHYEKGEPAPGGKP